MTAYDNAIDADNPVSHWKLGSSTTLAPDRKGTLNLETSTPCPIVAGIVQNNGGSQANSLADTGYSKTGDPALYNTPAWSMEVWVRTNGTKGSPIVCGEKFLFLYLNGTVGLDVTKSDYDQAEVVSTTTLGVGQIVHLVGTYDGTALVLYVNGIQDGRLLTDVLEQTPRTPAIGTGGLFGYEGVVDEVAWYDHALSPQRVQAHYLVGSGQYPDPAADNITDAQHVADQINGLEDQTPDGIYRGTQDYDARAIAAAAVALALSQGAP